MIEKGLKVGDAFTDDGRRFVVTRVNDDGSYISVDAQLAKKDAKGKVPKEKPAAKKPAEKAKKRASVPITEKAAQETGDIGNAGTPAVEAAAE